MFTAKVIGEVIDHAFDCSCTSSKEGRRLKKLPRKCIAAVAVGRTVDSHDI